MTNFGIVIAFGAASVILAIILAISILKKDPGNEKMIKISRAIQDGALAFLKEEYKTMALWAGIFAIVIGIVISPIVAICFIIGTMFSISSGFFWNAHCHSCKQ